MGRKLTDLANVCRATGYPVIEVDGWQNRGRGGTGGVKTGGYVTGPTHVMVHHTASPASADGWPDVNYCTFNDSDAPLCNLYLSRDGTIYVCASMATNCNGSGHDPCGVTADDSMNAEAIAVEGGSAGTGETWPDAQVDSYNRLCAQLCLAYGIPNGRIHGHAEYSVGRKVDPAGPQAYATGSATWNMAAFRADCAAAGNPQPEPEPEDDDMPKDLLIQCADGDMAGAIAVTPTDLSRIFFLSTSEDYSALAASGQYEMLSLSGATFNRIPGAEQWQQVS